jgi:hypothetical protein
VHSMHHHLQEIWQKIMVAGAEDCLWRYPFGAQSAPYDVEIWRIIGERKFLAGPIFSPL